MSLGFGPYVCRAIRGAAVLGAALTQASRGSAYRPFDGTDAAVADVGEVEIEPQRSELWRESSPSILIDQSHNAQPAINIGIKEPAFGVINFVVSARRSWPPSTSMTPVRIFAGWVPAAPSSKFRELKPFARFRRSNSIAYKLSRLLNCGPCVNVTNKYEIVE